MVLLKIRFIFLVSLIFASLYGFLEIAIIQLGFPGLRPILDIFSYFPFLEVQVIGDRISSVSYEPPFLAIYLITISGWMFSYVLTHKRTIKYIPAFLILVLTYFSGSRTALFVVFIQIMVFLLLTFDRKKIKKQLTIGFSILVLALFSFILFSGEKTILDINEKIESLNFEENLLNSVSNRSRFGMQYASFKVFLDHPLIGVGFGQQAFHNQKYFPTWAVTNNYEFSLWYKNPNEPAFPPGYNLYIRILAETGIIGLLLFTSIIIVVIYKSFRLLRDKSKEIKTMGIILCVSFIGFAINWLQIDSFRIFGFWIFTAVLYWTEKLSDSSISPDLKISQKLE